jgi:hypothetical protein
LLVLVLASSSGLVACYSPAPQDGEEEENVASVRQADGLDPAELDTCTVDDGEPERMAAFAQKCDDAIGASVPAFNCENGSLVDDGNVIGTVYGSQTCDRPNVLNGTCDVGARFQVLTGVSPGGGLPPSPDALIVAHCRKKGFGTAPWGDPLYGDIAVIQYNKKNGATCFYQSPVSTWNDPVPVGISGNVTAPKTAPTGFQFTWRAPNEVASERCVQCHDNGPFIRSPYLAHMITDTSPGGAVAKNNVLPGSGDFTWNQSIPYKFVGKHFQSWKAYSVTITPTTAVTNIVGVGSTGSTCTSCHRMGLSSTVPGTYIAGQGSAQHYGLLATAETQLHKNGWAPMWMKPGQLTYDKLVEKEAQNIADCARSIVAYKNHIPGQLPAAIPPADSCHFTKFASGDTCGGPSTVTVIDSSTPTVPVTTRVDVTVPLSSCRPGATNCPPIFAYWVRLRGPFWQTSAGSIPFGDANFRGSGMTIRANNNQVEAHMVMDPTGQAAPIAAPAGWAATTRFSEIQAVTDTTKCLGALFSTITDPNGQTFSDSHLLSGAGDKMNVLSGIIGNVAQVNANPPDFLRIRPSVADAFLEQLHTKGPPLPLQLGPLSGESWSFGCTGWTPVYATATPVVYSTSDVLLVPYPQSKTSICFITGLTGAWSSTRSGGTIQPHAEIYTGAALDLRLRVAPDDVGSPDDRVGAYASCIKLN